MKTKEKVREDLLSHLQKVGFNTSTMEVDVTRVTFDKSVAHASVSFRARGSTNIHDSMIMNYTMELRDGHWVVTGRADSGGHGVAQGMAGAGQANGRLPAGHPQVPTQGEMGTPAAGTQPRFDLPAGHPALESMPPATNSTQPLPPGHPKFAKPTQSTAPSTPQSASPQSRLIPGMGLDYRNDLRVGKAEANLGSAGLRACATNPVSDYLLLVGTMPHGALLGGELPAVPPTGLAG